MALTVGVATVLDSREVVVVVTGLRKALALSKAIGASFSTSSTAYILMPLITTRGGSKSPGKVDICSIWIIILIEGRSGLSLLCSFTPGR